MKYIDEYRDVSLARPLIAEIAKRVTRHWVLMEICGGQTHTLMRYGIDEVLPSQVELVHGPGCPVCVTPLEVIDKALAIACANPARQVVFLGIGFETTAPANAMAVWQAAREGLKNFSMLASQVLVPPAIRMLLESPAHRVQGFIAPGHVCTVMGLEEYVSLSRDFHVPIVVGGFEPVDLLEAISMLVAQLEEGRAEVENQYARSVAREGNRPAQQIMTKVFEVCDRKWRGIGMIPGSGLKLREEFAVFDAEKVFDVAAQETDEPAECISALVLQGLKKPPDCPGFGARCTPANPLGAPMVSSEGACAAYYLYKVRSPRSEVRSRKAVTSDR